MPSGSASTCSPSIRPRAGGVAADAVAAPALDSRRRPPIVTVGRRARTRGLRLERARLGVVCPTALTGGRCPCGVDGMPATTRVHVDRRSLATGIHQVDSPVFDADGACTSRYSGARGQQAPVSIFRVDAGGAREPFASGIVNATSLAYRARRPAVRLQPLRRHCLQGLDDAGTPAPFATDLGVACGLAFGRDGTLFVGDRSARSSASRRRAGTVPSPRCRRALPPFTSRSAPTGSSTCRPRRCLLRPRLPRDADGHVDCCTPAFGRPQGLAFDAGARSTSSRRWPGRAASTGCDAGRRTRSSCVGGRRPRGHRVRSARRAVVASNDTVYRFDVTAPRRRHAAS